MQQRAWVGTLVAIALVGGGILWRVVASDGTPPALAAGGGSSESSPAGSTRRGVPSAPAGPTEPSPEAAPTPLAARQQPAGQRRAYDRVRADGIRQRAAGRSAALNGKSRAGTASALGNGASATAPPPMTPEEEERRRLYIRDAVREQYFPIARSCYDELLARTPTASGKVVMSFAVVGDGEDGVVDRVELGDDTTMDDPEFALCVRESMYSTIFEPPPTGTEETTVVYPIVFAPDDGTPSQDPGQVEQTSR